MADPVTDASDLTQGGLVCGNPSRALRSRKKSRVQIHDQHESNPLIAKVSSLISQNSQFLHNVLNHHIGLKFQLRNL